MKILKCGDPQKVKEILHTKTFECSVCGCVFEANFSEYEGVSCNTSDYRQWVCDCPQCRKLAKEKQT